MIVTQMLDHTHNRKENKRQDTNAMCPQLNQLN
jgi:hypothetical protein